MVQRIKARAFWHSSRLNGDQSDLGRDFRLAQLEKHLVFGALLGGLLTSCGGSTGRRSLTQPEAELTALKIGLMDGDWAKMEVDFDSVTKNNPFKKYEFQRSAFGPSGAEDAQVTVKQDRYLIDLVYKNQQDKITMRSCPADKSKEHDLNGKDTYTAVIDVCKENSATRVGSVEVSKGAHVTIVPVTKGSDAQKAPSKPTPTNASNFKSKLPTDATFWVDPYSQAMSAAKNLRSQGDSRASMIEYIAGQGAGVWYGPWSGDIKQAVARQVQGARESGSWAVMIPYNIPYRDCGQHSAGGLRADEYRRWISDMASAIGDAKTIIVLEPDAVPLQRCLSEELKAERNSLLKEAVKKFKSNKNTLVYIDAGHSNFLTVDEAATRLKVAGIDEADGFALNTSNYQTTESNVVYGQKVSEQLGGDKTFVIDTSRNGNGPRGDQWCNPRGRAIGKKPTANTGLNRVDAFLWLKRAGESDGNCENGNDQSGQNRGDIPAAGQWWLEIAIEQAQNAGIK